MEESLWREVQPAKSDNLAAIGKKVEEAFYNIVATFIRNVNFIGQMVTQGERPLELM